MNFTVWYYYTSDWHMSRRNSISFRNWSSIEMNNVENILKHWEFRLNRKENNVIHDFERCPRKDKLNYRNEIPVCVVWKYQIYASMGDCFYCRGFYLVNVRMIQSCGESDNTKRIYREGIRNNGNCRNWMNKIVKNRLRCHKNHWLVWRMSSWNMSIGKKLKKKSYFLSSVCTWA